MTALTVTGSELHDATAWATRATPSKPVVPVLSGLLLDATAEAGDELVVTGYDYESRASVTIGALTTSPGRILVSARLLAAIAKTVARDVDVHISDDKGPAVVRCGRSEWTLPTLPVEDYPQLPAPPAPVGGVQAGDLRRALAQVLPALGRDDTLPMLTALRLESTDAELTLAGTDRFRLASTTIPWTPLDAQPALAVNLPGAALDTALRGVAAGDAGAVSIAVDDTGFALSTDTHLMVGRLLAVEYPRWRSFMAPENPDHHAVVEVEQLLRAVEQAMVAADTAPQVVLSFAGDSVEASASGTDRNARADAPAKLAGDRITVVLNAAYLRDAVTLHGTSTVTFHFGSSPTRALGVSGEGGRYQHTLMPVRAGASG